MIQMKTSFLRTRCIAFVYDFYNKCEYDDFSANELRKYHRIGNRFKDILIKKKLNTTGKFRGVKYTWIGDPPDEELINQLMNEYAQMNKDINKNPNSDGTSLQTTMDYAGDNKALTELINKTVSQAMDNWLKSN
jgi:hypothetical protein